eukprot:gene24571-30935_t
MGVKKDHVQALQYFRKAVELGDMNAHWLLGKMLMEGKGVSRPHYAEAAHYLSLAAGEEANVPQALYLLALMYEYGRGEVAQNFDLAAKYYRRAVEQQHLESTYNLAMMYAFGRGVPTDFHKARGLLETSATSDHAPSVYYVGVFKTYGYGCEINYEQAANWFERAAALHDDRVSDKSYKAAQELRLLIDQAHEVNHNVLDSFMVKNEGR